QRVSAALGLGAEGVSRLAQDLRVAAIPESSLISIELEDEDAQFAAGAVKTVSDFYLRPPAPQTKPLSEDERAEVEVYQKMLEAAREELTQMESESGLKGLAGERNSSDSRASELESEQASIERHVRDAETRLNLLERQAAELPSNVGPRAADRALAERLRALSYELQRQRNGLLTRYEASDPLVRELDLRLSATKEALDRSEVSGGSLAGAVSALHSEIDEQQLLAQADLSRWRTRERELGKAQDALSSKQSRLRRVADRRAELENTISTAEQRLEMLRGAGGIPAAPKLNISVIEPARALPIDRQKPLLYGFAALFALCAALIAALVRDESKKPVAYVADIAAATGAPVLCLAEETHSHVS
ncbi:MAG: hypothetical protein KDC27_16000, partial [Acidobacteria bacterium]|nr:hypothetical protein [Acidobacteriota bacterium]